MEMNEFIRMFFENVYTSRSISCCFCCIGIYHKTSRKEGRKNEKKNKKKGIIKTTLML